MDKDNEFDLLRFASGLLELKCDLNPQTSERVESISMQFNSVDLSASHLFMENNGGLRLCNRVRKATPHQPPLGAMIIIRWKCRGLVQHLVVQAIRHLL